MKHSLLFSAFATSLVCFAAAGNFPAAAADAPADKVDFNRDIRPILSETCFACHGPDKGQRQADLRLDLKDGIFGTGEGGQIVVPGKPAESELYRRLVSSKDDVRMPPPDSGRKLTPGQIELVRQWIQQGAEWKGHWAYIKPAASRAQRPPQPPLGKGESDAGFVRNVVDRFVLARLREQGLTPSPEADRVALIRRLSFDLRGLPPTIAEVDSFLADTSPNAYEKLVERFLHSAHFGERMAVHWLDLVRYADTNGIHSDNHREHTPFREYVIRAFNTNKPFDVFTREQLAGDLLPSATNEQKIASGYNRLNLTTEEGGAQPKEYMAKYSADRVRNASSVWLGATMGCCECHDHKYDPFKTKDFYSFAAFFADVQETAVGSQKPVPIPTEDQERELRKIDERLAALRKEKAPPPQIAALENRKKQIQAAAPQVLIAMAGPPRVIRILPRGNWLDETGPEVQPATPGFLKPLDVKNRRATRRELADWLLDADNPLTSRVFVNRLWKLYFGRGLSTSLEDFGSQGAWPTHPALLDWLAVEFRESGWNVKHIVRLLVTSGTYRQSSQASPELRQRDPYNRWLARQGRFPLEAEVIRDNALAVSGLLVHKIGGRSVKPYQPPGYWAYLNFPKREWQHDKGEDQYRKALYTYWCRTFPHPSMLAFNASSREECTVERPRSNTPLQALALLNDPSYVEAARAFAERILREGSAGSPLDARDAAAVEQRIQFAFRIALSRTAQPGEVRLLASLYRKHLAQYQADRKAAVELLRVGEKPPSADLNPAELAAWTSIARVIFNLHEVITRG